MSKALEQIPQVPVKVIVVSQSTATSLVNFHAANPNYHAVVGDPERKLYAAFGLERTRIIEFLKPRIIMHYLRVIWRWDWPHLPYGKEDVLQLGGDFLLNAQGDILFAYRSRESIDRPTIKTLVAAIRQAS